MALEFILKENVLTDDVLIIAEKNKVFKYGVIAYIKQYTFQNAWTDKETIHKFKSKNSLLKFLDKTYKDSEIDLTDTCIN